MESKKVRKIFIHKNYIKKYWKIRPWKDVPEFCEFVVVPEGWVQIVEEK